MLHRDLARSPFSAAVNQQLGRLLEEAPHAPNVMQPGLLGKVDLSTVAPTEETFFDPWGGGETKGMLTERLGFLRAVFHGLAHDFEYGARHGPLAMRRSFSPGSYGEVRWISLFGTGSGDEFVVHLADDVADPVVHRHCCDDGPGRTHEASLSEFLARLTTA